MKLTDAGGDHVGASTLPQRIGTRKHEQDGDCEPGSAGAG
jgi:hypothetical protein